jgi:hypothetical protein
MPSEQASQEEIVVEPVFQISEENALDRGSHHRADFCDASLYDVSPSSDSSGNPLDERYFTPDTDICGK